MTRYWPAIAVTLIVVGAGVLFYNHGSTILQQSRDALSQRDYVRAEDLADSVAYPPFRAAAAKIRADVRVAEKRNQESREAQLEIAKFTAVTATIDADVKAIHALPISQDEQAARSAGQKRHDDAVSAMPNLAFDLAEAKTEQSKVSDLQGDMREFVGDLRDIDIHLRPLFSEEQTSRLEQSIETASTDLANYTSDWSSAVTPMVDEMTMRANGNGYASFDTPQVERFYSDSTAAQNHAYTAITTAWAEIGRLRDLLRARSDNLKQKIVN